MDRELKIALYWSGRQPDIAHQINSAYSIDEYTDALTDEEFVTFAVDYDKHFIEGVDGLLLGRLQMAADAMTKVGADHKNYPAIQKNYLELLKITKPIIERLAHIQAEANHFDGLTITIKGVDDE